MENASLAENNAMEQQVIGKILKRLIPFLAILYVFCLLDRTNVSIAALTMQKDLSFSDAVYGTGAGIFFVGYFIFEVPSNLIMERVGARKWIARIMITWGIISAAMMFVRTPQSFYVMRFLLGLAEAGFFPGVMLYLTYWVPESKRAFVLARFLALTAVMGLIGGPLGGLLLKLNGFGGLAGWQWLFLIEGMPSVLLSIAVLAFLPDSPRHATWLTEEEKQWLGNQLENDARSHQRVEHFSWRTAITNPRIVLLCTIFILTSTANNSYGFFSPQLIKARSGGAWDDSVVAALSAIPAIVGALSMSLASRHSDRTGKRRLHVVGGYFIGALGILICSFIPTGPGVIFALSVITFGERIGAGSYWAVTSNLLGARAAAGGLAFINSVGNLGGFFGPKLMGELKIRNNGAFEPGLYTATALMFLATLISYFTIKSTPKPTDQPPT